MPIELKLSKSQLNTLVFTFNSLSNIPTNSRDVKVARSILDKLVLKFRKKYLEVESQPTFFTKKKVKKYTFSLEYHEAHYLENFVTIMDAFPMNEYDRNVLRFIKTGLNQQLA